jgi:hypothetical protein
MGQWFTVTTFRIGMMSFNVFGNRTIHNLRAFKMGDNFIRLSVSGCDAMQFGRYVCFGVKYCLRLQSR